MKKQFRKLAFVAVVAIACGINVLNTSNSDSFSDEALVNLEALASYVPSAKDCATYCQPDDRFTCYVDWGNDIELITCFNHRKK